MGKVSKAHRRFFLSLVIVFFGVMATFSLVNTRVNPLWVTEVAGWTNDAKYADFRQISRNARTAKAGLASSREWDVAFLGSSRVAIALDPAMPQWESGKVVNLGLSAGSLTEQDAMVNYILAHQNGIKRIYLGVDLTDLTTSTDLARNAGFYESPLNPAGDMLERRIRYVSGVSTFIASVRTMRTRHHFDESGDHKELPSYTALGHWLRNRSVRPVRDILFTDSIPHALRMIRQRHAQLKVFPHKLDALARIIDTCQRHKVELTLLIPPNHATYLAIFYLAGDADPAFTKDRETIVNLVAASNASHPSAPPVTVWDFNDFHPLNAEALPPAGSKERPFYWVDGTHALETLGHVMLKRMNQWPVEDPREASYGRRIDAQNLPDRIKELRAGYERYRDENPEEIKWLREIMEKYSKVGTEHEAREEPEPLVPNP